VARLVLGIGGGIAAYKTPELVRRLRDRGHEVRCVLTANAGRLVAKDALATVSGAPVRDSLWHEGGIEHIELPRWAEGLVVAPTTADLLGKFAHGIADDLLTTLFLALEPHKQVWLCPAMNTVMWQKPQVQGNLRLLVERGARTIGPVAGNLACGESGLGAMSDPGDIAAAIV
jgi:phosphopantothenoylcysteine decarboxylase/phosphopantothenate--cysteine ligase